jgi:hypothetical protein
MGWKRRPVPFALLQNVVFLRGLLFRWNGMYSEMRQDLGNWPVEFSDGMKAAGPAMLSWWSTTEISAQLFIEIAEKDQRLNTLHEMRRIQHSTSDAFLIGLFSQALQDANRFRCASRAYPGVSSGAGSLA